MELAQQRELLNIPFAMKILSQYNGEFLVIFVGEQAYERGSEFEGGREGESVLPPGEGGGGGD